MALLIMLLPVNIWEQCVTFSIHTKWCSIRCLWLMVRSCFFLIPLLSELSFLYFHAPHAFHIEQIMMSLQLPAVSLELLIQVDIDIVYHCPFDLVLLSIAYSLRSLSNQDHYSVLTLKSDQREILKCSQLFFLFNSLTYIYNILYI